MIQSAATEMFPLPSADMRQSGLQNGRDLASALLLTVARLGAGAEVRRQLSQLVLREISAAAAELRKAGMSGSDVEIFEQGCRDGCREELARQVSREAPARNAA